MARFRLVLVRPPGYIHAAALADAIAYLAHGLRALGHTAVEDNAVEGDDPAIIACAHLIAPDIAARLPDDTIIFNSEPLVGAAAWPAGDPYRDLLARCHVWDYAEPNLAALPHARASVIPFWFRPELARGPHVTPAGRRILFYGSLTPRRHRLLRFLAGHGLDLDVRFGCYGDDLSRALAGALAVLNLHKQDDACLFEPLRCFYALTNGVPVISEDTTDPTATPFRTAMSFVPSAQFVRDVVALVADREQFLARAEPSLTTFTQLDPLPALAAAIERYVSRTHASSRP